MATFVGSYDNLHLFTEGEHGVVIDSTVNMIIASGQAEMLTASRQWVSGETPIESEVLAISGLISAHPPITASAGRMYTIPKGVQAEAKKALEWRAEHHRGGTAVGMNTARTLAKGGQIGIKKLRHIAKYFPRHEVDKQGKGWSPKEDGFPSNGRIAWALWGGDAAWRWAKAIVEREDNKAVTASAGTDTSAFEASYILEPEIAPDFVARVFMDGTGMDRLYKIDLDGQVFVWDDARWDNLGHDFQDIWNYDNVLDEGLTLSSDVTHLTIDPESAIFLAARFTEAPLTKVTIEDIDANEAALVAAAIDEIDWDFIDQTLLAAGETADPAATDGTYTPDERSENASSQLRDATGKFATSGSRVMVGGRTDLVGTINQVNSADGTVGVVLDNGKQITVNSKSVAGVDPNTKATAQAAYEDVPRLDTSGILAEPRTPINNASAQIPGTLPAMTREDMTQLLSDWPAWVSSQRAKFTALPTPGTVKVQGKDSLDKGAAGESFEKKAGKPMLLDAYDHPLLTDWLGKKNREGYNNAMNYHPITAAAPIGDKPKALTPETSDVQPIYMAVVDPDDTQAVLNLISLIPASDKSTAPMVYKRDHAKWVRDPATLADLSSPTPPAVVPLDTETLDDVLKQVDTTQSVTASVALTVLFGNQPLVAAGGMDRNKGNAEKLRKYWTVGEGAAKIRWGTGGDWKRCVRHLSKYLGERAKGYCQLRHKDALGYYTSTHAKMDRAKNNSVEEMGSGIPEEVLYGLPEDIVTHEIPASDLETPLDKILTEADDMYDEAWSPEDEIIILLDEIAELDDNEFALIAAGGVDRNRGNAEKLRRYWTVGEGAAKIRWGTKGDWTRCVRQLNKYMGARAKGYCALRHKEMDGFWPGDRANKQFAAREYGLNLNSDNFLRSEDSIIAAAELRARRQDAIERMAIVAAATVGKAYHVNENTYESEGAKFVIPLVIPEGTESGDGRMFKKGAIEIRELPLPLLWQLKTGDGHNGSVVVGRIDHMEQTDEGIGNARGVFDTGAYGREAERMVREGFLRGVSADMDRFEAEEASPEAAEDGAEKNNTIKKDKIVINKARVMAVTIVPKPAFQECSIQLAEENKMDSQEETVRIPDGIYVEDIDPVEAEAIVASGMIAGAIPVTPPAQWFENPQLGKATPLTVDDEGRVFGHIATWDTDHIGLPFGTRAPRSRSKYSYFHTGVCRTEEGTDIPVGQLTLAGGHADITASAAEAVKHYDDTASAVADIHAGEDNYGIWVAGALRPGTTPEQVRALRASAPSGDWRPIRGGLELVAICQVNVPGFPVARARVASGHVMALVAAGASTLARMKSNPVEELQARVDALESKERAPLLAAAAELKAKFDAFRAEKQDAVVADGFYEEVEPQLVKSLEQLLADVVAFSFRTQGYHWNVKGADFAEYHALFGGIYGDVHGSIDPLAENILKLGFDAPFDITTFAAMSPLGTSNIESANANVMAYDLYTANEYLVAQLKNAFQVANADNEQGIADFIAGRIDSHQTISWQLKASCVPTGMETLENESDEEPYEMLFAANSTLPEFEGLTASAGDRMERVEEFAAMLEFATFTEEQRKELAKKGQALKDGSFPIRNEADLKNAIRAVGRAAKGKRTEVRAHIVKRAKALGAAKLIPESWKGVTASGDDLRARIPSLVEEIQTVVASADDLRARIAEFSAKADSKKA